MVTESGTMNVCVMVNEFDTMNVCVMVNECDTMLTVAGMCHAWMQAERVPDLRFLRQLRPVSMAWHGMATHTLDIVVS